MPAYDDATIAAAYHTWAAADPVERWRKLPDFDEWVDVPARNFTLPDGSVVFVQATPQMEIGGALYEYLDPAKDGAERFTVEALKFNSVNVVDIPGRGWHIPPEQLAHHQFNLWADPQDFDKSVDLMNFYTANPALHGKVPRRIAEDNRNDEDLTEEEIQIKKSHNKRAGTAQRLGISMTEDRYQFKPLEAWAAFRLGLPIEKREAWTGGSRISPNAPQEDRVADRNGNYISIKRLYEEGYVTKGHLPTRATTPIAQWGVPDWMAQAIQRLANLSTPRPRMTDQEHDVIYNTAKLPVEEVKNNKSSKRRIAQEKIPRESFQVVKSRLDNSAERAQVLAGAGAGQSSWQGMLGMQGAGAFMPPVPGGSGGTGDLYQGGQASSQFLVPQQQSLGKRR